MPGAGVRVGRGRGGSRGPSDCDRVGLGTGNGLAGPGSGTRLTGECDLLGGGPKRGKGNRGDSGASAWEALVREVAAGVGGRVTSAPRKGQGGKGGAEGGGGAG